MIRHPEPQKPRGRWRGRERWRTAKDLVGRIVTLVTETCFTRRAGGVVVAMIVTIRTETCFTRSARRRGAEIAEKR
jgi:hypothetical protein